MKRRWIDALFSPKGVCVVGSSSDPSKLAWGTLQAVMRGTSSQQRTVVAIDRHHGSASDEHKAVHRYKKASDVPVDLASTIDHVVLMTSCHSTIEHMRECIQAFRNVACINVVSGGFRESGGISLEQQLLQEAQSSNIRLIGPNSAGAIDAYNEFSSMFLRVFPRKGGLSLVSQSGGVCGAASELAYRNPGLGFSKVLALGNAADVGFVDALNAVGEDENTRVILLYLEGLGSNDDGDEFLETSRAISEDKPILALKGGTTIAGTRAVSSHTGALAGNERIYEAAFRSAGIVQAHSLRSMLDMAHALSCHPRVPLYVSGVDTSIFEERKYQTTVITNAGGPGALTVDTLVNEGAASVTPLPECIQDVIRHSPDIHHLSTLSNPVDLLGGATPLSYRSALEATLKSESIDAVVCLHVPTALSHPKRLAKELISVSSSTSSKPILAMMVSSDHNFLDSAVSMLHSASIPTFCHAEAVGDAFRAWKEREDRYPSSRSMVLGDDEEMDCIRNLLLSETQVEQGRQYLSELGGPRWVLEHEARELLDIVGIEQPRATIVCSGREEDVVSAADNIGYPIVLKRVDDIHKSDKGGVALNLLDAQQVRDALQTMLSSEKKWGGSQVPPILICKQISLHSVREFIVGFTRDDVFGPVVCFGSGGTMVEAVGDVAFALPPRSRKDTLDLMGQAKLAARRIAGGVRSEPPLDASAIADVVERCAALARAFPVIAELDVNPLMVGLSQDGGETKVLAADIKFRLAG